MVTRDEINQLPMQETVFQAELLWGARTASSRINSSLTLVSDSEPVSRLWRLLSLLLVPLAGALGGALYSLTDHLRHVGGSEKLLDIFISLLF